jgi:mono/diheme cytochrome c family protein
MKKIWTKLSTRCIVGLAACCFWSGMAWADGDSSGHMDSSVATREALSGSDVYRQYCMACHMADGKGAQGAGRYPALAGNPNLAAAGYPIYVVLNGLGGMPWFNGMLQDEEIAAVVNYIRTNFGNNYTDAAKAADVTLMRGPVPQE